MANVSEIDTFTAEWKNLQPQVSDPVSFLDSHTYAPRPDRTDFVNLDLRRTLTSARDPQFLLLRDCFPDVDPNNAEASFIPAPIGLMEVTRQNSINQVRFGQLALHTQNSRENVELVAVKPLDNTARLVNEYGAMRYMNSLDFNEGRPRAFQPVGFYRNSGSGINYLISRYEHSVISFDNVLWDPEYSPSEAEVCRVLGYCGVLLGGMHASGIMHGDAQIKNMAADNYGPRAVDLERSQKPAMRGSEIDVLQAASFILHDLRYCLEDFGDQTDLVMGSFTPPYLDALHADGSLLPDLAIPTEKDIKRIPL